MKTRIFVCIFASSVILSCVCAVLSAAALWQALPDTEVSFALGEVLTECFYPFVGILLLCLAAGAALAAFGAQRVAQPIERLNLDNPDERDMYPELRPAVRRIADQNRRIKSQLDAIKREHSQQDAMRREFTANVSHEPKTPLTSISGYAEIIRDGVAGEEDVAPFAGKIYDEAQRMILLVSDILRLSELDEAEMPRSMERVDLLALCRDVVSRLASIAAAWDVKIEVVGTAQYVMGVRAVLEEIVLNLCDNAIKYNKPSGQVRVTVERRGSRVALSVADTGIGIPPDDCERVFERFYRVDKSHSREIGGTGLGLSIVKHGAALHGAEITLESRLEIGTEITVLF